MSATGYDYEPERPAGNFLRLKKKGDKCKIRLVSTPFHYKDVYQGKENERFAWQVIDRADNTVKVFTAGVSIYLIIKGLAESEDWGDPETFDLTIERTEESTANFYKVIPSPKKSDLTSEEKKLVKEADLDVQSLVNKQGKGTKTFGEPRTAIDEDADASLAGQ